MDKYAYAIKKLEEQLEQLPKGSLTYKNIKGKKQPYLQQTINGKSVSYYIKQEEREAVFEAVNKRTHIQSEITRLKMYQNSLRDILDSNPYLNRMPAVGYQDFEMIRKKDLMYVDKTGFINEWWNSAEQVTLITRPRRFGKTLMLSMMKCFFSYEYQGCGALFEKLQIWKDPSFRLMQGQFPVISLSFAGVKEENIEGFKRSLCSIFREALDEFQYLIDEEQFHDGEKAMYEDMLNGAYQKNLEECIDTINYLSKLLYKYYGKKVILFIDEYDTPLQEAYMSGYWDEAIKIMRRILHGALKVNSCLEKALLTGITRITKESLFSDLNHLAVYGITSTGYETSYGFTEDEVRNILKCQDVEEMQLVKEWYDGYNFGNVTDIYNPWAIVNYLNFRQLRPYWANSGGTGLIKHLLERAPKELKLDFQKLLSGESIHKVIDENIVFNELESNSESFWPLLLASGYIKAENTSFYGSMECDLRITNKETELLFKKMVISWFAKEEGAYNEFCRALLSDDIDDMKGYLGRILLGMTGIFDVGVSEPERFYHGLILGLTASLDGEYQVYSNRESGFGRSDIMIIPKGNDHNAYVIEFKIRDKKKEKNLEETANRALQQIEEKKYETELVMRGISTERIRKYGFAFDGKKLLIRRA